MSAPTPTVGQPWFLPKDQGLSSLIQNLLQEGFTVIGPRLVDGGIVFRPVSSPQDLARGLRDEQAPGYYRLLPGDPDMFFEYVVGPTSAKPYLFPPTQRLFRMHIDGQRFAFDAGLPQPPKLALLGLRPCDLAAISVQDKVFGPDDESANRCETDLYYLRTRKAAFLIVVNCTRPGGNCFCVSMGTGPAAHDGFDLAMTELRGGFVIQAGSPRGAQILARLPVRQPSAAELELAELKIHQAREHMGKSMPTDGLVQALKEAIEHPHWAQVAQRCLSCGNCTMVCPTCFCSTVTDSSDLSGTSFLRTRQWESCFTLQFSYTTAGSIRNTIRGRYRHWIRHKLCTWWDQFGTSGCVGCGRCITWCPTGIDITEEARAVLDHTHQTSASSANMHGAAR